MRKLFTILFVSLFAFSAFADNYGILVNGKTYFAGAKVDEFEGFVQYLAHVKVKAGDYCQLYDADFKARWVVDLNSYSVSGFTRQGDKYVVSVTGCYDFYIKLKYEQDELYIGPGADCGEGEDVDDIYTGAVPRQCEAVLMQAFYNESYDPKSPGVDTYGDTKWTTLTAQASEIGEYGKFYPDASYICQNDEVNAEWNKPTAENPGSGTCWGTATGNMDDGENWDGARDWSHDMPKVQEMFIAYLKWMRNVMKYDGFRYDKGDGFNNWHHWNYNKNARPEIAFMECYKGTDDIQWRINGANGDLMALDFDLKWHVFNSIAGWDYSRGRGDCIMSRGDGRHSVTFIESHDWFLRPDNDNEFGGRGNSMTPALKARLMQANALLLSMPGIPCIFYPHWKKYKEDLKPMIIARKWAGVHNESEVKDEYATATGYQATIVGHNGWLILCLGDRANKQGFEGYTLAASNYSTMEGHNESFEMWVNSSKPKPTAVEEVECEEKTVKAEKFIQDGKMFIRLNGQVYDITGRKL